jgi:hypothetical protein
MTLLASPKAQAGRIGAFVQHSRHDSRETSAAARAASESQLNQRLLTEIDPDNLLPDAERARRLEYARKAHFARLAMAAAQARAKKRQKVIEASVQGRRHSTSTSGVMGDPE